MSTFDEAPADAVAIVEASPIAPYLTAVTMIRDLEGRLRFVLEFRVKSDGTDDLPTSWQTDKANLETALSRKLEPYWGKQIWRVGSRRDLAFQALKKKIEDERHIFVAPFATGRFTWYKLERQYSRSSWFASNVQPPWSLTSGGNEPAIISFYSFKGGVGRTVATAATGIVLARAGKSVVLLDMDLEAPGLGTLLLGASPSKDEGIVDYLVELQARGTRPRNLMPYVNVQADATIVGSKPMRVLGAGQISESFIQKIARLDFNIGENTQANPIKELLQHIREEFAPDFILMDVRSGIHDLGGLSLNGLSHLDVLFGRDEPQGWSGLSLVLKLLASGTPREVFVVHAQVPPKRVDPDAHDRFRRESYNQFAKHYYGPTDTMDDIADPESPYGIELPFMEALQGESDIARMLSTFTQPDGPYEKLARHIGLFLERETLK